MSRLRFSQSYEIFPFITLSLFIMLFFPTLVIDVSNIGVRLGFGLIGKLGCARVCGSWVVAGWRDCWVYVAAISVAGVWFGVRFNPTGPPPKHYPCTAQLAHQTRPQSYPCCTSHLRTTLYCCCCYLTLPLINKNKIHKLIKNKDYPYL